MRKYLVKFFKNFSGIMAIIGVILLSVCIYLLITGTAHFYAYMTLAILNIVSIALNVSVAHDTIKENY